MSEPVDVLIIGLGPVGAVLAALCGQAGLSVRAVERDHAVYKNPRAIQMDQEVLRQLNLVGVADAVQAASVASEGYEFVNREGELLVCRYPPAKLGATGYPFANMFHQPSLEQALRARLDELSTVEVSLGTELTGFEVFDHGVVARLSNEEGQASVRARYLIACDGGRSTVRRQLGVDMYDMGFEEPWMVVDVKLKPPMTKFNHTAVQLCDPHRPVTSAGSGPGRHRWEFMLKPEDDRDEVVKAENIKRWLADWIDPDKVELERRAIYEFHGVIAERWRQGRVMLIGDAAHQMPPFLGQGLCSGVRDACNLAWKLNAVLQSGADEKLLDTLQGEREPHVAQITRDAIDMGRIVCVADEEAAAARDARLMGERKAGKPPPFPPLPDITSGIWASASAGCVMPEPWIANTAGQQRLDDLIGYAPVLVLAETTELAAPDLALAQALGFATATGGLCRIGSGNERETALLDPDGYLASAMQGAQALLAKPDRVVFGTGTPGELLHAWEAYLSGKSLPGMVAAA
ncbi:MAG: bifunctional 3-(3-hydroxy-phenyl)propionate/3-hydroxycinnamic acid hydroxylase [Pseudomonadota bacterium]